jgi:hypothetical protein
MFGKNSRPRWRKQQARCQPERRSDQHHSDPLNFLIIKDFLLRLKTFVLLIGVIAILPITTAAA